MVSRRNCMIVLALVGGIDSLAVGAGVQQAVAGPGPSFACLVVDGNEVHLGEPFDGVLLVEAPQGVVKADFSALTD